MLWHTIFEYMPFCICAVSWGLHYGTMDWWSLLPIKGRHWSRLQHVLSKRHVCTCYQPGLFWVGYLLIQELFSLFRADVQVMIWKNVLKHSLLELENGKFFPSRYSNGCGFMEEEFQSENFKTATGCQDVRRVRVCFSHKFLLCLALQKMYWYRMELKASGYVLF